LRGDREEEKNKLNRARRFKNRQSEKTKEMAKSKKRAPGAEEEKSL